MVKPWPRGVRRVRQALRHEFASLAGSASFVFFSRVAGAALVLVTHVLLARWMGPEQLGHYVLAFAWCIFLAVLAGCGLPSAAVRFMAAARDQGRNDLLRGYFRREQQTGLTAGVLIALAGVGVVLYGGVPQGGRLALLLALAAVPVFVAINVYTSVGLALSWFRLAMLPNVVLRPALLLAAVALAWSAGQALTAARVTSIHLVVAALVLVPLVFVVRARLQRECASASVAFDTPVWLHTALPLMVVNLLLNFFQEVNVIAAGVFLDPAQLALYSAALRIAFLIAFGVQAVNTIVMPRTAALHASDSGEALRRMTRFAARLQFLWALAAVVALALAGQFLLGLFGPAFVVGYRALMILALAQLVSAAFGPVTQLLSMTGHQIECVRVMLCSLAVMLGLNALLSGAFGIDGAAFAAFVALLVQAVWLHVLVRRLLAIDASVLARLTRE